MSYYQLTNCPKIAQPTNCSLSEQPTNCPISEQPTNCPVNLLINKKKTYIINKLPPFYQLLHSETAGFVEWFDEKYNQSTVKKPLPILKPSRLVFSTTTSDDPIIAELAEKINAEEQGPVTTVYATDFLLAVLMSAPRSVYSWDLVLTKKGNTITIDKRESSDLDLLTVDETSKDPPLFSDSKNSNTNYAQQLHQEATRLNMAFQEQVLKKVF